MGLLPLQCININSDIVYYLELIILWMIVAVLSYYIVLLLDKNKYTSFLLNGKQTK